MKQELTFFFFLYYIGSDWGGSAGGECSGDGDSGQSGECGSGIICSGGPVVVVIVI